MEVIQTAIEGVVIIEPRLFNDARGYFFESFSQRDFDRLVRTVHFVQDNESKSSYGVLRGLHFQKPPYAQSKYASSKAPYWTWPWISGKGRLLSVNM